MSTDTDEEGNGGAEIDWAEDEGQVDEIVSPVSKLDNPQPSVPSLLITSNVGSIFEDPDILIPQWKKEVLQLISRTRPHFVALHFQEVNFNKCQIMCVTYDVTQQNNGFPVTFRLFVWEM